MFQYRVLCFSLHLNKRSCKFSLAVPVGVIAALGLVAWFPCQIRQVIHFSQSPYDKVLVVVACFLPLLVQRLSRPFDCRPLQQAISRFEFPLLESYDKLPMPKKKKRVKFLSQ